MSDFDEIWRKMKTLKVLLVGDVMLDRYLQGAVSGKSPEADVPLIKLQHRKNLLGGAANVGLNLASIGCKCTIVGMVGNDHEGAIIKDLLADHATLTDAIITSETRRTTVKTRVMDQAAHLIRVDSEDAHDIDEAEFAQLKNAISTLLKNDPFDVLIIQDYNKGLLSNAMLAWLLAEAKDQKLFVAVDPKFKNFFSYKDVDLFKPNLKELKQAFSDLSENRDDVNSWIKQLHLRSKIRCSMVTLSEKGIVITDQEESKQYDAISERLLDVTGAGDSVISIGALALFLGIPKDQIASLCLLAGASVIKELGAVPLDMEYIREGYAKNR